MPEGRFAMHGEISPDGCTLVYRDWPSRDRARGYRLFLVSRPDRTSPWSKPVTLDPAFDSPSPECHASIGPDGTLVLTKDREVWRAEPRESGAGWESPKRVGDYVGTGFTLAADGSARLSDGLAISYRQPDGSWSRPERIGVEGRTPHLAPNGRTLYFQADDLIRGRDLWMSRLVPKSQ